VRLRLPFRKARTPGNLLVIVRLRTCLGLVEGWPCRSGEVPAPVSARVLGRLGEYNNVVKVHVTVDGHQIFQDYIHQSLKTGGIIAHSKG